MRRQLSIAVAIVLVFSAGAALAAKEKKTKEGRDGPRAAESRPIIEEGPRAEGPTIVEGRRDRDPGPVLDFAGDVLAGVFKIVTLPLTLLADLGRDGWHGRDRVIVVPERQGAYASSPGQARDYYGADARYYGPPPGFYH